MTCSEKLVVDTLVGRWDVHQIQHVVDVAFGIGKDRLFRRLLPSSMTDTCSRQRQLCPLFFAAT